MVGKSFMVWPNAPSSATAAEMQPRKLEIIPAVRCSDWLGSVGLGIGTPPGDGQPPSKGRKNRSRKHEKPKGQDAEVHAGVVRVRLVGMNAQHKVPHADKKDRDRSAEWRAALRAKRKTGAEGEEGNHEGQGKAHQQVETGKMEHGTSPKRVCGCLTPLAQRRRGGAAQKRAATPAVRCSDWLGNGANCGQTAPQGKTKSAEGTEYLRLLWSRGRKARVRSRGGTATRSRGNEGALPAGRTRRPANGCGYEEDGRATNDPPASRSTSAADPPRCLTAQAQRQRLARTDMILGMDPTASLCSLERVVRHRGGRLAGQSSR